MIHLNLQDMPKPVARRLLMAVIVRGMINSNITEGDIRHGEGIYVIKNGIQHVFCTVDQRDTFKKLFGTKGANKRDEWLDRIAYAAADKWRRHIQSEEDGAFVERFL